MTTLLEAGSAGTVRVFRSGIDFLKLELYPRMKELYSGPGI